MQITTRTHLPLPSPAKSAFIISALLTELEDVITNASQPEYTNVLLWARECLSFVYGNLDQVPQEYLASKAGEMTIKAMHASIQQLEELYASAL